MGGPYPNISDREECCVVYKNNQSSSIGTSVNGCHRRVVSTQVGLYHKEPMRLAGQTCVAWYSIGAVLIICRARKLNEKFDKREAVDMVSITWA